MKSKTIILLVSIWAVACTSKNRNTTAHSSETKSQNSETSEQTTPLPTEGIKLARAISTTVANAASEPTRFTIDTKKENTLTTAQGTTITIPKDAFVDANGDPVQGDVTIAFNEYHTASDIILSGIPMHIETENGNLETFETAGMFDIAGQDATGNEVRIASNKTLSIELATFKEDTDYNFYKFDKTENIWTEEYKNTPVASNTARARFTEEYEAMGEVQKPIAIQKASSSDFVFELAVDQSENPEFKHFDDVMWKLTDNTIEDAQLFRQQIRDPNLTCIDRETSLYKLTGTAGGQKISTQVQPVLFGSNWKKAQARFNLKMTSYKASLKEREKEKATLENMAKLQRNIQISGFGTYNCDRYTRMKLRKKISFKALFLLPAIQKAVNKAYLIIKKEGQKEAIPLYSGQDGFFIYAPHENNTLITFDDDGTLYEFTNADFERITAMNPKADSKQTLSLKATTYKIASQTDMTAYLDRL